MASERHQDSKNEILNTDDSVDACMTPEPDSLYEPSKFRRGWAASSITNRTAISNRSNQSSIRSSESVLARYRNDLSETRVSQSEHYKETHPNRPSSSRWKQQNMPAWQPIYRPFNVVSSFIGFGLLSIAIGVFMLITTLKTNEIVHDYTKCKWIANNSLTCADVIERRLLKQNNQRCKCEVKIEIMENMATPVYLYYNLDGFYQNHRRYVTSVDYNQLLGKDVSHSTLRSNCEPYAINGSDFSYAPCGAIANSFFTDKFTLFYGSSEIKIKNTDIAWNSDKRNRYKNPPNGWSGTTKPVNWSLSVQELDESNPDNNGYQNEHLIVWMRTAAFADFRKLWGRVEPSIWRDDSFLPKGSYRIIIEYNYPTVIGKMNIPKKLILSNTSWLGGRNLFLPILYLIVGGLCIVFGLIFLLIVWKVPNSKKVNVMKTVQANYNTMSPPSADVQFAHNPMFEAD